jgi:general stress protein YciG
METPVKCYYTYAYLREDRTPYYIGKGKENRIYCKNRTYKPPEDKSRIIFLKQNLTEEEAFKHEKYMIAVFGRKDNGTGILRNMTDGGEGGSNLRTLEQRRKSARKGKAGMTPEQRSEAVRKGRASMTPEQRSESARKAQAKLTPQQRSERTRKGRASMTPEQRSESARKAQASLTQEQRSEQGRRTQANRTPEQKSEIGRKGGIKSCGQKWQCTITGFITNSGSLSSYQKARGIDTSNRVRLS